MSDDTQVSRKEREVAIAAIARHPKGAVDATRSPTELWGTNSEIGRVVYVTFDRVNEVPEGTIYHTWVVHLHSSGAPSVSRVRSRIGAGGRIDTLPPDPDDP